MREDQFESPISGTTDGIGQIIGDLLDPFDLEVHPAISESIRDSRYLPTYVERAHDRPLRAAVDRARTKSTLSVLVGSSSTGKTCSCFEAVRLLPGWRIWHPVNPNHSQALKHALDEGMIGPRTVLWLNELQYYLKPSDPALGEQIAAGLRELIRDDNRGPILVLGTIWPDHWRDLTQRPDIGEADLNAQRRALLSGREIRVPPTFSETNADSLPEAIGADQQLMRALSRTDKKVTQFLAGGFELVSRYETAPAASRLLIDVSIDASRFGIGSIVPITFLRKAVPDYFDDDEWNELDDDWLEEALSYAARPSLGIGGPLAKIRPRSGQVTGQDIYRLADFLEESGSLFRQYVMPPESFWNAAASHAESAEALLEFAYQLEYRGRYKVAARMYLLAARRGDSNGWLYLAENRKGRGDSPAAEAVLRIAADNGITDAKVDIAEILYGRGDAATAKAILKALLVDDSQDFENRPIAWDVLAQICDDTGDLMTARHWMRLAASAGDAYAGEKLAANGRGSEKSALRELRMAATRVRLVDRKLERARQRIVSLSARSQEAFEWAVEKYTADSGEEERIGDSADSLIMLGRIYCAGGEYGTARTIFLRAINVLDDPYEYGVIPALVELVKVMKKEGDWESAERFWKFGLELDGTVCDAWNAVDQLPLGERSSDGQPGSSGREGDSAVGGLPYVLYDLLRDIPGYENVQWLTQTRAPDRGRDLSLDRFLPDAAGALRCERVIVQAKHWLRRSVRPGDITDTLAAIKLWEPPVIRCLVIATSGRFSADAVAWIERQNDSGAVPLIEPWPTPKLEALIAERPELARAHGLCD